ncbi:hypothetical protein EWM64_g1776 [Hericium alpestre]|uniref:Uncharacterized protein n=1 Tax=Hericium alpestre TaxID=135208 RepID=A0A4Z0A7A7_9AGAM|nr:hypothetical protein EWM64_g1776 [Hericium alpestre]
MLEHHASTSYLVEAHKDSAGNHGRKSLIKVKLESTPKVRAAWYKRCASRQKKHEPLDQLPPQYLVYPNKPRCNVPLFHFGVGATMQQLQDYAVQHGLVPEEYRNNPFYTIRTVEATVRHLDRISGVNLYIEPVRHPKYTWVVARYSNHTWYHEELAERQEHTVLDFIRRELNIVDMPQWHPTTFPY